MRANKLLLILNAVGILIAYYYYYVAYCYITFLKGVTYPEMYIVCALRWYQVTVLYCLLS